MNEDAASDYAPHSREESVTAALLVVIPWYSGGSFTPSDARNVCSRRCELEFLMEFLLNEVALSLSASHMRQVGYRLSTFFEWVGPALA
jgi:hypothetical protein